MPRVPRSGLRRLVFAVDGREEEEQRRKRHRESGDRLRRTAGPHLPIQSKGAKCDSRRPKIFRLALRSTRHGTHKPLTFNIKGSHFSKSQKTQNHTFSSRHFAPLCAVAFPSPSPIGGGAPSTGRCPTLRPPPPPSLSRRGKQHDFHAKVHSFSSKMHHSSSLPHTRVTRHAPSHRALSEFAIPAFTLHLHTYPIDIQMLTRELHPHFLLHRGEGKGGEAFTHITLLSNDLHATGEEVKAKNEKRRTRPRARKTPKSSCIALRFWEYAIGDALREPPGRKISQTPSLLTTCAPPHTSGHFNTISCSTLLMDCSIV